MLGANISPMPKMSPLLVWLKQEEKSQRWLAGRLGISDSFLSELLSGKRAPSLGLAVKIENFTGITARQMTTARALKKKADEARAARV